MTVDEIKKELDRYEIAYDSKLDKAGLQALLDAELAKRASGDDSEPEISLDIPEEADAEPVLTDKEREAALAKARSELDGVVAAKDAAAAEEAELRKSIGKLLPATRQAGLAECNFHFQNGVTADTKIKGEVATLAARFQKEAEKILSTESDEE